MTKDIGTYHLKIELLDGRGWIDTWNTGWRYTHGTEGQTKLDATAIEPTYESEDELFENMRYMYLEGNFSCDCNKALFLARAYQKKEPDDLTCEDSMTIERLTAIRPNRSEAVLYESPNSLEGRGKE